jgi:hypothetical protein
MGGSSTEEDPSFTLDQIPSDNVSDEYKMVRCPFPTLITEALGIDPSCADDDGYPALLSGPLRSLDLGELTFSDIGLKEVWLIIEKLFALADDISELPQLFWTSWETKSLTGKIAILIVLLVGFLLHLSVAAIKAFCCGENDGGKFVSVVLRALVGSS